MNFLTNKPKKYDVLEDGNAQNSKTSSIYESENSFITQIEKIELISKECFSYRITIQGDYISQNYTTGISNNIYVGQSGVLYQNDLSLNKPDYDITIKVIKIYLYGDNTIIDVIADGKSSISLFSEIEINEVAWNVSVKNSNNFILETPSKIFVTNLQNDEANIDKKTIIINWNEILQSKHYGIEYRLHQESTNYAWIYVDDIMETKYKLRNLSIGTYSVAVMAFYENGVSEFSKEITFTIG